LGWHVPQNFEFPARCKLDIGWKLWLQGLPSNQIVGTDGKVQAAPIRPFRKFNPELLPKKVRSTYELHWKPIFKMMELTENLAIIEDPGQINAQFLEDTLRKQRNISKLKYSTFSTSDVLTLTPGKFLHGRSMSRNRKFCARAQNKTKPFFLPRINKQYDHASSTISATGLFKIVVVSGAESLPQPDSWNSCRYINLKLKTQSGTITMTPPVSPVRILYWQRHRVFCSRALAVTLCCLTCS